MMAKVVAGAVAAYALSPIDLIPDFIPVLGYLDDIIVPLELLRNQPVEAMAIVTDGLASYGSALRELGLEGIH